MVKNLAKAGIIVVVLVVCFTISSTVSAQGQSEAEVEKGVEKLWDSTKHISIEEIKPGISIKLRIPV